MHRGNYCDNKIFFEKIFFGKDIRGIRYEREKLCFQEASYQNSNVFLMAHYIYRDRLDYIIDAVVAEYTQTR